MAEEERRERGRLYTRAIAALGAILLLIVAWRVLARG
jgi:hypothetical protein